MSNRLTDRGAHIPGAPKDKATTILKLLRDDATVDTGSLELIKGMDFRFDVTGFLSGAFASIYSSITDKGLHQFRVDIDQINDQMSRVLDKTNFRAGRTVNSLLLYEMPLDQHGKNPCRSALNPWRTRDLGEVIKEGEQTELLETFGSLDLYTPVGVLGALASEPNHELHGIMDQWAKALSRDQVWQKSKAGELFDAGNSAGLALALNYLRTIQPTPIINSPANITSTAYINLVSSQYEKLLRQNELEFFKKYPFFEKYPQLKDVAAIGLMDDGYSLEYLVGQLLGFESIASGFKAALDEASYAFDPDTVNPKSKSGSGFNRYQKTILGMALAYQSEVTPHKMLQRLYAEYRNYNDASDDILGSYSKNYGIYQTMRRNMKKNNKDLNTINTDTGAFNNLNNRTAKTRQEFTQLLKVMIDDNPDNLQQLWVIAGGAEMSKKFGQKYDNQEAESTLNNQPRSKNRLDRDKDAIVAAIDEAVSDPEKAQLKPLESFTPLIEDFNLRGIQLGEWVTNQETRQIAPLAYRSLENFADVMGLRKDQVGFGLGLLPEELEQLRAVDRGEDAGGDNGVIHRNFSRGDSLGLAFGARGRSSAAAHYEPGLHVINLTRKSGAGALAHELGHAMDYALLDLFDLDTANQDILGKNPTTRRKNYVYFREIMETLFDDRMKKGNGIHTTSDLFFALGWKIRSKQSLLSKREENIERFRADMKGIVLDRLLNEELDLSNDSAISEFVEGWTDWAQSLFFAEPEVSPGIIQERLLDEVYNHLYGMEYVLYRHAFRIAVKGKESSLESLPPYEIKLDIKDRLKRELQSGFSFHKINRLISNTEDQLIDRAADIILSQLELSAFWRMTPEELIEAKDKLAAVTGITVSNPGQPLGFIVDKLTISTAATLEKLIFETESVVNNLLDEITEPTDFEAKTYEIKNPSIFYLESNRDDCREDLTNSLVQIFYSSRVCNDMVNNSRETIRFKVHSILSDYQQAVSISDRNITQDDIDEATGYNGQKVHGTTYRVLEHLNKLLETLIGNNYDDPCALIKWYKGLIAEDIPEDMPPKRYFYRAVRDKLADPVYGHDGSSSYDSSAIFCASEILMTTAKALDLATTKENEESSNDSRQLPELDDLEVVKIFETAINLATAYKYRDLKYADSGLIAKTLNDAIGKHEKARFIGENDSPDARFGYWSKTGRLVSTSQINRKIIEDLSQFHEHAHQQGSSVTRIDAQILGRDYGVSRLLKKSLSEIGWELPKSNSPDEQLHIGKISRPGKKSTYWARPTELFARTVERAIEDTLELEGRPDAYLANTYKQQDIYPINKEAEQFRKAILRIGANAGEALDVIRGFNIDQRPTEEQEGLRQRIADFEQAHDDDNSIKLSSKTTQNKSELFA